MLEDGFCDLPSDGFLALQDTFGLRGIGLLAKIFFPMDIAMIERAQFVRSPIISLTIAVKLLTCVFESIDSIAL